MRNIFRVLLFVAATISSFPQASRAQTWFKVATASTTLQVTIPAGTVYRYGNVKDDKWSTTTTAAKTFTVWNYVLWGGFPFADPDYGSSTAEELQVQETAVAQTITLIDYSKNRNSPTTSMVVVPALPVVVVPPPPPPVTTTTTYTFSCAGTVAGTITVTPTTGAAVLSSSTITLSVPCNGVKQ